MDWSTLLQNQADVVVTAIVGIVGILAALASPAITACLASRSERIKMRHQWRKERHDQLTGAIEAHVDRMLRLMNQAYWRALDEREASPDCAYKLDGLQGLNEHRELDGVARARVAALASQELSTLYDQLNYHYGQFRHHYGERHLGKAGNEMRSAQDIAGKMLAQMQLVAITCNSDHPTTGQRA